MSEDRLDRARRLAAEVHPQARVTLKRHGEGGRVTFGMPANLGKPETNWPLDAFDRQADRVIVDDLRRSWRV